MLISPLSQSYYPQGTKWTKSHRYRYGLSVPPPVKFGSPRLLACRSRSSSQYQSNDDASIQGNKLHYNSQPSQLSRAIDEVSSPYLWLLRGDCLMSIEFTLDRPMIHDPIVSSGGIQRAGYLETSMGQEWKRRGLRRQCERWCHRGMHAGRLLSRSGRKEGRSICKSSHRNKSSNL